MSPQSIISRANWLVAFPQARTIPRKGLLFRLPEPSSIPTAALSHRTGLEVRVEKSFSDLESLREQWDATAANLGGSIYMSFDWTRTWWEFYGAGKELRLFLFYLDGMLASVVPLYIDRVGFKPLHLAVARLVGPTSPRRFNPPIHPDLADRIFQAILRQLFESDRCDVFNFGPVSDEHKASTALETVARSQTKLVGQTHFCQRESRVCSLCPRPSTISLRRWTKMSARNENMNSASCAGTKRSPKT